MRNSISYLIITGLAFGLANSALGQWTSQTIPLRGGWNAVYLEVQPEPRDCETLFAGLQVESVWRFNQQVQRVQFISNPNQLVPNQPGWLTWLPPGDPLAGNSRLHVIEGGRPYLIKRANAAAQVNWTLRGTPVSRSIDWQADSLNLVGFPLAPQSAATYQGFFSHSLPLATNSVYRLSANGIWVRVNTPASTAMQVGEAFWIRSTGPCTYPGTLQVNLARGSGLAFGRGLAEDNLRIRNASTQPATITVRTVASEAPHGANQPVLAGAVPLAYWLTGGTNNPGWANLPAELASSNVPAGGEWNVRLAVRRAAMAPFVPPPGVTNVLYQTVLEVSDGVSRLRVPVSAQGADRTGLWIGTATFNKVSQPGNPALTEQTDGVLQFRLIVHVDNQGRARLLQKVLQRWQNGTPKAAGGGSTNQVVDQPGQFVLLTDETRAAQFQAAALRDGQEVGRRISTAAFGFRAPVLLSCTGPFGANTSVCAASVAMGYNDPLNPFVHRYHPDHDNLADDGANLTAWNDGRGLQTSESYTVTRDIQMQFLGQDPDGMTVAGFLDNRLAGSYQETFYGLHKDRLIAQGTFQLFRVSEVGVLDPPL